MIISHKVLVFEDAKLCTYPLLIPSSNDKISAWSKLKAFADDKIKVDKVMIFIIGRVENIWVKEKMLVTSIFCFSHHVFN